MSFISFGYRKSLLGLGALVLGLSLLASCASSSSSNGASSSSSSVSMATQNGPSTQPQAASSSQQAPAQGEKSLTTTNNQYLVKTLKVSMQVQDTRKVANDLQQWIASTDTRSISSGTDYEQVSANAYTIDLNVSVQSSLYPQIYTYLRDYSNQHGGHLSGFTETVQNVTGDYVDTQSRLKTLHAEQARLLDLMSHAQAIGDVIAIEQKLTDVEGQIETYEGRLKDLTNQVSFYTVTIHLEPISTVPASPSEPAWSFGQVFQQAFTASIVFAQTLLTLLIWILAFAWYVVPVLLIIWLIKKFRGRISSAIPAILTPQKTNVKP